MPSKLCEVELYGGRWDGLKIAVPNGCKEATWPAMEGLYRYRLDLASLRWVYDSMIPWRGK